MSRLQRWLRHVGIILTAPLSLAACSTTPSVPEKVYIPIPVPCEVEQVPETELPVAEDEANVARKAAVAAARIQLLLAENLQLRAANNNPCPKPE